jgi:predicted nucleic acid-binding protein
MRVTTHPRVMRKPWSASRDFAFVSALLASPGLGVLVPTERHADVVERVIAELPWLAGNLVHDAHTAVLMREHGIVRICTRDMDFHSFPFLEVIEPV